MLTDINQPYTSSNNSTICNPFPLLDTLTKPIVGTTAAAYYLNRAPQTLRTWACYQDGPLKPIHINGRLAWKVAQIKQLLNVEV